MINYNDIAKSFKQGNEEAFEKVFKLLYSSLCLYARKFVSDDSSIEELVDDCFLRVWNKRTLFSEYSSLKAYLFTSVRNASLTWLSSKKLNMIEFIPSKHDLSETRIEGQGYLSEIEASLVEMLPKLLLTLTDQQKTIIEQIFF